MNQALVDFAFQRDPGIDRGILERIFSFWEQLCVSRDPEVSMLARDVAWAIAEQSELARFKRFVGPCLRKFICQSPAGAVLMDDGSSRLHPLPQPKMNAAAVYATCDNPVGAFQPGTLADGTKGTIAVQPK